MTELDEPGREFPSAVCDGGPHLLVPDGVLPRWRGVEGGSPESFAGTDYARACDVPEPAGVLQVADGAVLVVAGGPPMTYWVADEENLGGHLVIPRAWGHLFGASEIRAACRETAPDSFQELPFMFENPSHLCRLIAACDYGPQWTYGVASVPLAPGSFRVSHTTVTFGGDLQLRLLRLTLARQLAA